MIAYNCLIFQESHPPNNIIKCTPYVSKLKALTAEKKEKLKGFEKQACETFLPKKTLTKTSALCWKKQKHLPTNAQRTKVKQFYLKNKTNQKLKYRR